MTTTSVKLYQYEACPFCWKVRALLAFKGIDYETVEVHPLNKKELAFSEDYKKVPVLTDGDKQINDSDTIMRYLDEKYPEPKAFEKENAPKQEEERWLEWGNEKLVRALPPIIYQTYKESVRSFDYITKIGKFSWLQQRLVKYLGAFVMTMVAKKSAKSQGIEDPEQHFVALLEELEQHLSRASFIGGGQPHGADLALYGILHSVENLSAFPLIKANTIVFGWYQRMGQLLERS